MGSETLVNFHAGRPQLLFNINPKWSMSPNINVSCQYTVPSQTFNISLIVT